MNKTQLASIITPIAGAVANLFAVRYPLLDPATWNTLVTAVIWSIAAAAMGYLTKKSSLANSLGGYTDTTVVTDQKTADSLPANNSVVSNTVAEVKAK